MPMPNSPVDYPQELSHKSIVIIDNEPLLQDCLAEAMRGEFPHMRIIGIPTVRDLYRPKDAIVEAVLLKARPESSDLRDLTQSIRMISRHFTQAPVIVISPWDDASSIEAAVAAGAQGLIPITASFKIAVAALRLVLAGGAYYPRPISNRIDCSNGILEVTHENGVAIPADVLVRPVLPKGATPINFTEEKEDNGFSATFTAREVDVLSALRLGRSNKWIAHHLQLSENTIKVHIRHIMRKLHATNRTEAVILSQSLPNGV
jgi:two-component system, NarL family, nitrate/nitrite response regulator NarL